jgi:hypothetical protein
MSDTNLDGHPRWTSRQSQHCNIVVRGKSHWSAPVARFQPCHEHHWACLASSRPDGMPSWPPPPKSGAAVGGFTRRMGPDGWGVYCAPIWVNAQTRPYTIRGERWYHTLLISFVQITLYHATFAVFLDDMSFQISQIGKSHTNRVESPPSQTRYTGECIYWYPAYSAAFLPPKVLRKKAPIARNSRIPIKKPMWHFFCRVSVAGNTVFDSSCPN